jgi:dephospho-CoA kinase
MKKIAITGGIGSGKSTAVKMLQEKLKENVFFYSVDKIVHELYKDIKFQDELVREFGTCSRKMLSDWAFESKQIRQTLEKMFARGVSLQLDKVLAEDDEIPAVVVEFPLLFEMGWENRFDLSILVTADIDVRWKRVEARDEIARSKFDSIVGSQMHEDEKIDKADIVIYNNYDKPEWLAETIGDYVQTEQILKELKKCHLSVVV